MAFFAILLSYVLIKPPLSEVSHWIGVSPMDFVPLYPWFALVLLGIFLESVRFHQIPLKARVSDWLAYLGKHSLVIYLIHQPILFSTCYLIYEIHYRS